MKNDTKAVGREIGTVERDGPMVHVWTMRGWTWYPNEAFELAKFAKDNGWGVDYGIPSGNVLRMNSDLDLVIPVLIGREAGPTVRDMESLAYLFRIEWVCEARGGKFKLSSHIYKTNVHGWVDIPSMAAIRKIISQHPVTPRVPEPRKG